MTLEYFKHQFQNELLSWITMPMRRNSHINDVIYLYQEMLLTCFCVVFFFGLLHKTLSHVSLKSAGNFQGVVGF